MTTAPGTNEIADHLNSLSADDAVRELSRCCASEAWARRMVAVRPFASDAALLDAAERVWWALSPDDWLEAFAAHPRIGERSGSAWSSEEQSGMDRASGELEERIREGNRRYEETFGHVFLVCATGLSAREMADALERRLRNDPATELRNAAAEQAKITRLRLEKLTKGTT
ncbi:MAG: 2-oxo-4-hydroxy-4-carboxy-5-ureidoimidazoline decarboxylase [Gemmatimonadota bacterium]